MPFEQPSGVDTSVSWFMSTSGVPGFLLALVLTPDNLPVTSGLTVPYRFVGLLRIPA